MARKQWSKLSLLKDDLKPVVRQISKKQRFIHPEIWARWVEILGKNLAARAVPDSYKNGKLFIAVQNSSWMQELTYLTQTLIEKFDDRIGPGVVKEIRLILDPNIKPPTAPPQKPARAPVPPVTELPSNIETSLETIKNDTVRDAVERALRATWNQNQSKD